MVESFAYVGYLHKLVIYDEIGFGKLYECNSLGHICLVILPGIQLSGLNNKTKFSLLKCCFPTENKASDIGNIYVIFT